MGSHMPKRLARSTKVIDGERLLLEIRRQRLNQRMLAQIAGVDAPTISRIVSGYRPSVDVQQRILTALGEGAEKRILRDV